jgi:large subunit ribosomal protein L19
MATNTILIEKIEAEQAKKNAEKFNVGDSVKVHTRVKEGEKERIQIYSGIVISRRGRGHSEMFTVRRISFGEGVERIFPVNSPMVEKVVVDRVGSTRRAKLYYMRGRKGKEAMAVKEKAFDKSKAKSKVKAKA